MAIRHTFKVYERLKREQHINALFQSGKALSVFPIRFIYLLIPAAADARSTVQVGFSVPKKRFRHSVDRHRVRRLMAEAWRLSKQPLKDAIPPGRQLHVFLVCNSNEIPEYSAVATAVQGGIDKLMKQIAPSNA